MNASTTRRNADPAPSEIARGTPPARTPETLPDTDLQPDQAPVRDTPEVEPTGNQPHTP